MGKLVKAAWGKIFVVFVVEHWTTNILPTNEASLNIAQLPPENYPLYKNYIPIE